MLNGNFIDEVYMQPPLGYDHPYVIFNKPYMISRRLLGHGFTNLVLLLNSLGLLLLLMMLLFLFIILTKDLSFYCFYVDSIIIIRRDLQGILEFK